MSRAARPSLLILFACLAQACAAPPCAAAPRHDEPVAADEPRAVLHVQLDLPRTASCEESFDLALYGNRAVDRIEWEGSSGKCSRRKATIRYLSRRITREKLLESVQKLGSNVEVLP
jgi:hypothetical protein